MDYNQERGVNSSTYVEPEFDPRPSHKITLIGITIVVILAAILFFILLYNPNTEIETQQEPAEFIPPAIPEQKEAFGLGALPSEYKEPEYNERLIKVNNLKLCSKLANNLCTELEENTYKPGQQVKIYFEVTDSTIKTVGNSNAIAFEGDFKIYDEFQREITAATAINFYTYVNTGSVDYLKQKAPRFQTFIPSDELDPPGYYTAEITIRDLYSTTESVQTVDFWLK